jgi:hypothetical protein
MADLHRVEQWLVALGRVTAVRITAQDAADFVDKFATMLAGRFPDETFTPRSVEHVAAECKYLPTYGEIVALLRSLPAETPQPRRDNVVPIRDDVVVLSPEERKWLAYWHAREGEGFAPLREPDGSLSRPEITDWRAHTLSLLRQYAPDVWVIVATADDRSAA